MLCKEAFLPGFVKLASAAMIVAMVNAPAESSAQNSTGKTAALSGKSGSVLDRIRERISAGRTPEEKARQWFDRLDIDKNEEITKNELFESIRRRFEAMDISRDKFVSKPEYIGQRKDPAEGENRFGVLDSNSDGRLSMSEFASPANWRFDRIDRNLDGKISRTEAARLFDRPGGKATRDETGECFYVDRQIVRVKEEVAETFKKRGYPKADCQWIPEVSDEEKAKQFEKRGQLGNNVSSTR